MAGKAAAAGQASTEAGAATQTAEKPAADAAAAAGATGAAADTAAAEATAKAAADAAAGKGKEGDQAGGAAAAEKTGAVKDGEQSSVTYALTVPEGAEELVSKDQLDYFVEVAKASGWTNEDAQAEVNAHVAREQARI